MMDTLTSGLDLSRITQAHINIRDARHDLKRQFEEADADLKRAQQKLEAAMLDHLNKHGMDAVRTEFGTFYAQEEITPSASDWNALYEWIKEHDAWEALERRIKKTFIKEYQEAHSGGLPPGVSVFRERIVRVRRGK
jgi:KaiC/GvpD/RAD55 family RecA-like ATPase